VYGDFRKIHLPWIAPIELGWAEQPAARVVGEPTRIFIVWINRRIWLKLAVDPFRNEGLKFRSIVSSSAVGPLAKLYIFKGLIKRPTCNIENANRF
jgi:hypothetical protein